MFVVTTCDVTVSLWFNYHLQTLTLNLSKGEKMRLINNWIGA